MKKTLITILTSTLSLTLASQDLKTYNGSFESGTASYQYYENENYERIYNGSFSYKETSGKSMTGNYVENQKHGNWIFKDEINASWRYLIKGNFKNGKKQGKWTYTGTHLKSNKEYLKLIANYNNGKLVGSFSLFTNQSDKNFTKINGVFDTAGYFEDEWITKVSRAYRGGTSSEIEQIFKFRQGVCYFFLERNVQSGEVLHKFEKQEFVTSFFDSLNAKTGKSEFNNSKFHLQNQTTEERYDITPTFRKMGKDPLNINEKITDLDRQFADPQYSKLRKGEDKKIDNPQIQYIISWVGSEEYKREQFRNNQRTEIESSYYQTIGELNKNLDNQEYNKSLALIKKYNETNSYNLYSENQDIFNLYSGKLEVLNDSIFPFAVLQERNQIISYYESKRALALEYFETENEYGYNKQIKKLLEFNYKLKYNENSMEMDIQKAETVEFDKSIQLELENIKAYSKLKHQLNPNHTEIINKYEQFVYNPITGSQTKTIKKKPIFNTYLTVYENSKFPEKYSKKNLKNLQELINFQKKVYQIFTEDTKPLQKAIKKANNIDVSKQLILDF